MFPEVDPYPSYRVAAPVVIVQPRLATKPETMIERYVAAAATLS